MNILPGVTDSDRSYFMVEGPSKLPTIVGPFRKEAGALQAIKQALQQWTRDPTHGRFERIQQIHPVDELSVRVTSNFPDYSRQGRDGWVADSYTLGYTIVERKFRD